MKNRRAAALFLQFLRFGCFTFGGGWSIVAQMRKVYVECEQCITNEDLLDLASVGRSLPGTMIGNIAMIFGYQQAGIWGGIACVLGLTIPPMAILAVITMFYTAFRDSYWVAAAMKGIRCAVVPIILCALVPMMKTAFKEKIAIPVAIAALIAFLVFDVGAVGIVIGGAVCGLLISHFRKRGEKS